MSEIVDNNEEQLILKQELLKSEILAKNYDGNKFLQFCLNIKENGDDMNNWTYEELKKCVDDFIESQKPKPKENQPENNKNIEKKEEEKKNNTKNETVEKLDNQNEYVI